MRSRANLLTLIGLLALVMLITPPAVPGTRSCPQTVGHIDNLTGLIVPVSACPDFTGGPLAAFTYERTCTSCGVLGFQILVNSTWSAGAIVLYTWNFGDGTPQVQATSPSVTHNYQSLGPNNAGFQVALTVQDSAGQTNTITQTITPLAVPRFVFQPTNPATGQPITFDSSASQVDLNSNTTVAYGWSFGDGTGGTGAVVNHAYAAPRIYRVVLSFFNVYGSSQVSKTVNDPAGEAGGGGGHRYID